MSDLFSEIIFSAPTASAMSTAPDCTYITAK